MSGDPLSDGETNVAIACQGGGSHTAFTAGVLSELFADWPEGHRLVGMSGTSGGAICAVSAWYALVADDESPGEKLDDVWSDIAASDVATRTINDWLVWGTKVETSGAPIPEFSPYQTPVADWGQSYLRDVIERHVDFERLRDLAGGDAPKIAVGTVDVNGGEFETFCDDAITPRAMLASAAVPDLFEAVEIDGHWHWDGLFSQNPPIQELMTGDAADKPHELWVVQINPQTRDGEPKSLLEIKDRRNELAGNISLNQELRFIERVNDWVAEGHLPEGRYTHTEIRRVQLGRTLEYASKLDRSPEFLTELIEHGESEAATFLRELGA